MQQTSSQSMKMAMLNSMLQVLVRKGKISLEEFDEAERLLKQNSDSIQHDEAA